MKKDKKLSTFNKKTTRWGSYKQKKGVTKQINKDNKFHEFKTILSPIFIKILHCEPYFKTLKSNEV
jgi:hypothetical protein